MGVRRPRTDLKTLMHLNPALKRPYASLGVGGGFGRFDKCFETASNFGAGDIQFPQHSGIRLKNVPQSLRGAEEPRP